MKQQLLKVDSLLLKVAVKGVQKSCLDFFKGLIAWIYRPSEHGRAQGKQLEGFQVRRSSPTALGTHKQSTKERQFNLETWYQHVWKL